MAVKSLTDTDTDADWQPLPGVVLDEVVTFSPTHDVLDSLGLPPVVAKSANPSLAVDWAVLNAQVSEAAKAMSVAFGAMIDGMMKSMAALDAAVPKVQPLPSDLPVYAPLQHLDADAVVTLLERTVARYSRTTTAAPRYAAGLNTPPCIIGAMLLHEFGLSRSNLHGLRDYPIGPLLEGHHVPFTVTATAGRLLSIAQHANDQGRTWGVMLGEVRRARRFQTA